MSQKGFEELLKANGFTDIEKYAVFSNHKYPLKIISLNKLDECKDEIPVAGAVIIIMTGKRFMNINCIGVSG